MEDESKGQVPVALKLYLSLPVCLNASKRTMPTAVAKFKLRTLGFSIGILKQWSQ